ncbi:uncharacterized protein LOC128304202 [Anopheles moucheti]|uniref:uncharacterized protein LOC128304202 n=1 Tax=Anopheles moucheti TaxID=186751 RepID=UPI0022F00D2E|nr:uncharacterized protein LOC128304202 [Anopheles moucheti]
MENTPKSSRQSTLVGQRDIREVMNNIRSNRQHILPRSKESVTNSVSSERCTSKATTPSASAVTVESFPVLANSYARELFFRHTNITQVVAQIHPEFSGTAIQMYAAQIYEDFVTKPRNPKVRKYIEAIRFDTRYAQGMFRIALKVPITSAQEQAVYQQKLAEAGLKKIYFVDMTRDNLALDHKEKVVSVLKERFGENWPVKLGKLPTYLSASQRLHEAAERRFRYRLKHHSSLKGSQLLRVPDVIEQLTRESRIPSEQRTNLIWPTLRFDSDYLNKKYSTGDYCKFQNALDMEPENLIEYRPQRTTALEQEENEGNIEDNNPSRISSIGHNNNNNGPVMVEPSPKPTPVQRALHSHRTATPMHKPMSRNGPCPIRAGRISYESDTSLDSEPSENGSVTNHNIQSIATDLNQDSPLPDSDIFTPFVTSTQNQSQAVQNSLPVNVAEVTSSTRDPLQLTGAISTLSPFHARIASLTPTTTVLPFAETIRQDIHTDMQLQPSSCIPPYQAQKPPTPSKSTPTISVVSLSSICVKQQPSERSSQSDLSGYEGYVEILPNSPEVIIIDSNSSSIDFNTSRDRINDRTCEIPSRDANQMTTDQNGELYLSCAEGSMDCM